MLLKIDLKTNTWKTLFLGFLFSFSEDVYVDPYFLGKFLKVYRQIVCLMLNLIQTFFLKIVIVFEYICFSYLGT